MAENESREGAVEALRDPVGRFERVDRASAADVAGWIEDLAGLPGRLGSAVVG